MIKIDKKNVFIFFLLVLCFSAIPVFAGVEYEIYDGHNGTTINASKWLVSCDAGLCGTNGSYLYIGNKSGSGYVTSERFFWYNPGDSVEVYADMHHEGGGQGCKMYVRNGTASTNQVELTSDSDGEGWVNYNFTLLNTTHIGVWRNGTNLRNVSIMGISIDKNMTLNYAFNSDNANDYLRIDWEKLYLLGVVKIYLNDEITLEPIINYNITIYTENDTYDYSINEPNFIWRYNFSIENNVRFSFSNENYNERNYYIDLVNETITILEAYLLKNDDGETIDFLVRETSARQDPIPDVLITAEKQINNDWVYVDESMTDDSGATSLFLDQSKRHRISALKDGYIPEINYITPTRTSYDIFMDSTTGNNVSFSYIWDDIQLSLIPDRIMDNTTEIRFDITSYNNTLEYFGLNVTWNGTVLYSDEISGVSSGGNITATVNLTNYTNTYINISAWFKKDDYDKIQINRYYMIIDHTLFNQSGLYGLTETFQTIPPAARLIIAITISMFLISGLSYAGIGLGGSGLLVMIFMGFLTIMGWFTGIPMWLPLYSLFILTILVIYLIKSRW